MVSRARVGASAALAVALLSVAAAHLEFGNYKVQQIADEVVSFLLVGEWGGQSLAPYTTPGQLAVASAMADVATTTASTFVLSTGGNFYGDGIQGARLWRKRLCVRKRPARRRASACSGARAAPPTPPPTPCAGCTARVGSLRGLRGPR